MKPLKSSEQTHKTENRARILELPYNIYNIQCHKKNVFQLTHTFRSPDNRQ